MNILLGTDKKFALFMKEESQGINYFTSLAEIPVKIKMHLRSESGKVIRLDPESSALFGQEEVLSHQRLSGKRALRGFVGRLRDVFDSFGKTE